MATRTTAPALLAAAAFFASSGMVVAAHAEPVTISYSDVTYPIDVVQAADCVDGTEHIVGTERVTEKTVAHPNGTINVTADLVDDFVVDFSNGWTGTWTTKEHYAYILKPGQFVLTNVHRDSTQVYDQTGAPIGVIMVRVVEHTTVTNGATRAMFAHFRLTCDL